MRSKHENPTNPKTPILHMYCIKIPVRIQPRLAHQPKSCRKHKPNKDNPQYHCYICFRLLCNRCSPMPQPNDQPASETCSGAPRWCVHDRIVDKMAWRQSTATVQTTKRKRWTNKKEMPTHTNLYCVFVGAGFGATCCAGLDPCHLLRQDPNYILRSGHA